MASVRRSREAEGRRQEIVSALGDARLRQLGRRLVAFHAPELLSPDERAQYEAWRHMRWSRGPEVFRWFTGRKPAVFKPVIDAVAQIGTFLQMGGKPIQTKARQGVAAWPTRETDQNIGNLWILIGTGGQGSDGPLHVSQTQGAKILQGAQMYAFRPEPDAQCNELFQSRDQWREDQAEASATVAGTVRRDTLRLKFQVQHLTPSESDSEWVE